MGWVTVSMTLEASCLLLTDNKGELNRKHIYECRCDERLKAKGERSTRLVYTALHGGLEHLKTETEVIDEVGTVGRFAVVCG
jgi:hypothetical protein